MESAVDFWDALAPHHATIENSYLDLPSLRHILDQIISPVLVVGAGQGLIVDALLKKGFQCDGVDLSAEMIRYALQRRGLALIQADARAMPFKEGVYKTVISATGVVDFMLNEEDIRAVLKEIRRAAAPSGAIFLAFYRMSPAIETFLVRLRLLQQDVLLHRKTLELNRLAPLDAIAFVSKQAQVGSLKALLISARSSLFSSWQEKRNALQMRKIFALPAFAERLIQSAPEQQPYRNEAAIRRLLGKLKIPIKRFEELNSCFIAQI